MDKLYKVTKFEHVVEMHTRYVHLYITPDEDLILYFNNSPRHKLIHVYGNIPETNAPFECEIYATVDNIMTAFEPCSNSCNVITFIMNSETCVNYEYISFPLANIIYNIPLFEYDKERSLFLKSVNPPQGYYDSDVKRYIIPLPPSISIVDKISNELSLAEQTKLYMKEHPSCGGKDNLCNVNNSSEPALINIDDITPTPYCSSSPKINQVDNNILVENFETDDTCIIDMNNEDECPCKSKNKNINNNDDNALIYFTKYKFMIFIFVVLLMFIVSMTLLLYFKK